MDTRYPRHIRFVAAFLTVLGVWYAVFGVYVLANLSSVTQEWIVASGDPDFRFDFDIFAGWAGLFSVFVILLGVLTAIYSGGIVARREWACSLSWLGLTVFAVIVHVVRLPIHAVDDTLTRPLIAWFVVVCVAYGTVWVTVQRRLRAKWPARLHEPPNLTNQRTLRT
jgi:hypothetical protein